MDNTKKLKTLSLCTGYSGIERGLELAGESLRTLAHVEIEAFAIANLVAKMEAGALGPAPIWSDLKTFPAHLFRDRVDLITGGYPCQPFSAAGKRKGADDPRHLWPHIRRHVQTIRPFRCFFENVEGHISLGLQEVIADLEADSYKATWGIFSASEVGAPHRRKRVFILADSNGDNLRQQPGRGCRQDRQGQALFGVNGQAQPVANTNDAGQPPKERQGQARDNARRCSAGVADADSERQSGRSERDGRQAWSRVERSSATELADASGKRLERHTGNGDPSRESKQTRSIAESGVCEKFGSEIWDVEPQLGRVANGIADRVDRLRLLGNGVVPQQAAKAWIVLSEQVNEKDGD